MTVAELIEILKDMPQDAVVETYDTEGYAFEITTENVVSYPCPNIRFVAIG